MSGTAIFRYAWAIWRWFSWTTRSEALPWWIPCSAAFPCGTRFPWSYWETWWKDHEKWGDGLSFGLCLSKWISGIFPSYIFQLLPYEHNIHLSAQDSHPLEVWRWQKVNRALPFFGGHTIVAHTATGVATGWYAKSAKRVERNIIIIVVDVARDMLTKRKCCLCFLTMGSWRSSS